MRIGTDDDLKRAYDASRIARLGWSFERALDAPPVLTALRCLAGAIRKKRQENPGLWIERSQPK